MSLPLASNAQIFLFIAICEFATYEKLYNSDTPWDLDYDFLNMLKGKSPEQIKDMQLKELTHCRLAMVSTTAALPPYLFFTHGPGRPPQVSPASSNDSHSFIYSGGHHRHGYPVAHLRTPVDNRSSKTPSRQHTGGAHSRRVKQPWFMYSRRRLVHTCES